MERSISTGGNTGRSRPLSGIEGRRATIWLDRPFAALRPDIAAFDGVEPTVARPSVRVVPAARQRQVEADARIAALDDLGLAAIVCDPSGRVLACSQPAAAILNAGEILAASAERLVAIDPQGHARLRAAIVRCGTAEAEEAERITLALTGADGLPARLDVAPLRQDGMSIGCIIQVTENRPGRQVVQQLVSAFGLTRAEAEVAIDLAHGLSAREIAERRSASSDTVRKQTQAIFQKLDVSKATRLSFVLGPFLR
ncbi:LuxR C-terminal-related transcriptional regulator [Sphingomonas sp. KR1UV-12]|uniref:LuxR C-terminal-related transcriptional regulator n=1 Tax=Sphingomonas aurea TaxID=3063994 RepID=A0ABT9EJT5_9SPHN|nr:LuxR C-terminal-related transcriptional regulator [Sphingomonas sp. KR1UV-12]MDP1027110.1 LuxR C-terminal-related transcriptional regulator [Sphingomonas sp. KR1UV-12]